MSELRHFHGTAMHAHRGGDVAHDHKQPSRRPVTAVTVILIVVLVLIGFHEVSVFASKGNPPASCQLLGGQWNMFTGWHCG